MDIIAVVLGADTKKDRTKDSIKIIEYAFANYKMVDMEYIIHDKFDNLVENSKFNIDKGINNDLGIDLEDKSVGFYPVKNEEVKDVKIETEIVKNLTAPVYTGDKIRKDLGKYWRSNYI